MEPERAGSLEFRSLGMQSAMPGGNPHQLQHQCDKTSGTDYFFFLGLFCLFFEGESTRK